MNTQMALVKCGSHKIKHVHMKMRKRFVGVGYRQGEWGAESVLWIMYRYETVKEQI